MNQVYSKALEGIDAYNTSLKERMTRNILTQKEFNYGEVYFSYFIPILDFVEPKPGEIFYDLGCGTGKPLLIAALAFPWLAECKGIELL